MYYCLQSELSQQAAARERLQAEVRDKEAEVRDKEARLRQEKESVDKATEQAKADKAATEQRLRQQMEAACSSVLKEAADIIRQKKEAEIKEKIDDSRSPPVAASTFWQHACC